MRWLGNVARVGERMYAFWVFGGENLRERDRLEYLEVDGTLKVASSSETSVIRSVLWDPAV